MEAPMIFFFSHQPIVIPVSALMPNGRTGDQDFATPRSKRTSSANRSNKREKISKHSMDSDDRMDIIPGTTRGINTSRPAARNDVVQTYGTVDKIIHQFEDICVEVKSNIQQIEDVKIRAELYLQFLDKDSVKSMVDTMALYARNSMAETDSNDRQHIISQEGQSLVVKANSNKHSSSTYDVWMKAKEGVKINPADIYKSIVAAHDIVANDWLPINVVDLRIEMMSQSDALKLMDILNNSKYGDEKISDLFEVSTMIKSNYAVKSIAIDGSEYKKLSWTEKDNKVNIGKAIRSLSVPTNKHWFTEGDIENIESYKLGNQDKFVIKIMVSKECFHRFLGHNCINRKIDIGLDRPLTFQEEVRHDACWNCLNFGHSTTRCKETTKCRFCGMSHNSATCQFKSAPTCFRCKEKQSLSLRDEWVSHDALANGCPFVKERRDWVRNRLREKFGGRHEQQ